MATSLRVVLSSTKPQFPSWRLALISSQQRHLSNYSYLNGSFWSGKLQKRQFSGNLSKDELIEYVEGKVFEVLKAAAKCQKDKLSRTASFEELGFDSLDGVELVLAMEEHFGFDIQDRDAEKITTVMDAIQIFHSYCTKKLAVEVHEEGKVQNEDEKKE